MPEKKISQQVKQVGRNIEPRKCRSCPNEIPSGVYCDSCLDAAAQS